MSNKNYIKYAISEMERSDIYDSVDDLIEDYIYVVLYQVNMMRKN